MFLTSSVLLHLLFLRPALGEAFSACTAAESADEAKLLGAELLQRDFTLETPSQSQSLQREYVRPWSGRTRARAPSRRARATLLPPAALAVSAVGDLTSFVSFTLICITMIVVLWIVFCELRLRYPAIYSDNVVGGFAPRALPDTYCGWICAATSLSVDDVAQSVTLDAAMLLEFSNLCMKILAMVGIPMLCVIGPMNWALGGNRAGQDHLSFLSLNNVAIGSWLFWVHALVVWAVVVVVTHQLHLAMQDFLPRRHKWLREMSEECASTVMVDKIPPQFQSEAALQALFQQILPGIGIRSVYVCKDTADLEQFGQLLQRASLNLKAAEGKWKRAGKAPDCRPMIRDPVMGSQIEAIPFWRTQQVELKKHIKDARDLIEQCSPNSVNTSSGFVTFNDRTSAAVAVRLSGRIDGDLGLWQLDHAPEPADILWAGFRQDDITEEGKYIIGYTLAAAVFAFCLPLVIGLTNLARVLNFDAVRYYFLHCVWAGIAPTAGLQLLVGTLPTFLSLIFQGFFMEKSLTRLQLRIQVWYFWFQVALVLLTAALAQNLRQVLRMLMLDPFSCLGVLVDTIPFATHFFMNFLVLQWLCVSIEAMRCDTLLRFKGACNLFGEQDAKKMAEREDQNFTGIGSRSTRLVIVMSIAIIFGTLAPPIAALALVGFALCRIVYGYLICFAETKRSDSGGVHFVTTLRHIFVACIIYTVLMTAVLLHCGGFCGPGLTVVPSLLWVIASKARFEMYNWESLPIQELLQGAPSTARPIKGRYVQPELLMSDS